MPPEPELAFEDFIPGAVDTFGPVPVTREAIVAFARAWDPQPFHLDEAAAKVSILGGLSASGWHTGGLLMRLNCDGWLNRSASWGGNGVDEIRWLKPVRPGDLLRARRTILETRPSQSRPQMGLLMLSFELVNQDSAAVMTQRNTVMMGRRGRAPVPAVTMPRQAPPPRPAGKAPLLSGWYEDAQIGAEVALGSHRFETRAIKEFAQKFDPQPFHLDEAAGARSHFGTLIASGWHTAAASMRCFVEAKLGFIEAALASGERPPELGPSPGVRDLRWPRPVLPDDTVFYSVRALSRRPVSRPGWGLVESHNLGVNQFGETVFEFTGSVFHPIRG